MWGTDSEQLQQELPHVEKEMSIRIQRLDEKAGIQTKGSKLAAGQDLYSIEDIPIPASSRVLVKIGLEVPVPEGTYGCIAPRTSAKVHICPLYLMRHVWDGGQNYQTPVDVWVIHTLINLG